MSIIMGYNSSDTTYGWNGAMAGFTLHYSHFTDRKGGNKIQHTVVLQKKYYEEGPLKDCWLTTSVSNPVSLGSSI